MKIRFIGPTGLLMVSLFFLLTLNGCVVNQTTVTPEKRTVLPESGENIHAKISEIQATPVPDLSGDKLLELSFLYSHKTNLKPDYNKALQLLTKYTAITPKQDQFELAEYIISLLEKIKTQDQVIVANKIALKKEMTLKKMIAKENKGLKKKITSLKKLDIRLEKQRLGVE